jgi:DNA-binding response OmpR family regulator
LRKKIDKPFSKQLIKTKIGFGYYLDILWTYASAF